MSESGAELLLHDRDARGVHTLTLNAPRSFNVLSEAMMAAMQQALDAVAVDDAARVVVIAAIGRAFCEGDALAARCLLLQDPFCHLHTPHDEHSQTGSACDRSRARIGHGGWLPDGGPV
jgi:enoyl-CoA hydratase/carnithine racemase